MKKLTKITALLLTVALLLGLAACGGPTYDESLLGVYTCYAVEMMGYEMAADEVLSETTTLELKQGGKGNMSVEGASDSIQYTLDGEAITVEIEGETAEGTLKDGVIDIEIMEMHMFFIQEGKEIPVTTPPEVGFYNFSSAIIDGESFTAEELAELGGDAGYATLQLNEDGTGCLIIDGEAENFNWADGKLTVDGDSMDYILDGDTITLSVEGFEMVFVRGDASANTAPTTDTTTPAEPTVEAGGNDAAGSILPISLDVADYHFEIVGLEQFTDYEGEDAVRIYIDYTNNSDDMISFYSAISCDAYQEGYQLVGAYSDYDIPETENGSQQILPGLTVRVCDEFVYKPDGGELEFRFYEYYGDDPVVVTVDPANLPGAPTDSFTFEPHDSSSLVEGLSASGTLGDVYDLTIRDLELTTSWDGDEMVRVFIDYTNNSTEETALWDFTLTTVMQDGVELLAGYAKDKVETDDTATNPVAPGETVTVTKCYRIHDTGSPIAYLIDGFMVDGELGTVLELP